MFWDDLITWSLKLKFFYREMKLSKPVKGGLDYIFLTEIKKKRIECIKYGQSSKLVMIRNQELIFAF